MKGLRILILFIVVLSGCGRKYVEPGEGEMFGREWSVLDAEIVSQDNESVYLNLKVKDFVWVMDSVEPDVAFQQDDKIRKKGFDVKRALVGFAVLGCTIPAVIWLNNSTGSTAALEYLMPYAMLGCVAGSCCITGALVKIHRSAEDSKPVKIIPNFFKVDAFCVDSELLFYGKVKVSSENKSFEETYYTDEDGNLELKFREIIPEPTKADSIINLIIQHEEMVDTVDVKIVEMED